MAQITRDQNNHAAPAEINADKLAIQADSKAESYYCGDVAPGAGTVVPKYAILFVLYAPPGSAVNQGISKVDYGSESTAGSTIGQSKSFKQESKVTASVSSNAFGATSGVSVSYDSSVNTQDSSALEFKKTVDSDVTDLGPSADGINHDFDEIWLWTNPSLGITWNGADISTVLTTNGGALSRQFLSVGSLKQYIANPSTCPSNDNVCTAFKAAGFTVDDFKTILSADPFANGATALDPKRFIEVSLTFPYEAGSQTEPYTLTNESSKKTMWDQTLTQALNVTVSAGYSGSGVTVNVTDSNTWTWTHEYSQANSMGTTQKASLTIGAPSTNWHGPTNIGVYFDCLWQTFYFQYLSVTGQPLVSGTVYDASGNIQRGALVTLTFTGRIMRTYTDSKGHYAFYAPAPRITGTLSSGTFSSNVSLMSQNQTRVIGIPPQVIAHPLTH